MKFPWRSSTNNALSSQGLNTVPDVPMENEITLGRYHLCFRDGDWELSAPLARPLPEGISVDTSLLQSQTQIASMNDDISRLRQTIADLERTNDSLQFQNKVLVAMCTISEGDRRCTENELRDLVDQRRVSLTAPGLQPGAA